MTARTSPPAVSQDATARESVVGNYFYEAEIALSAIEQGLLIMLPGFGEFGEEFIEAALDDRISRIVSRLLRVQEMVNESVLQVGRIR